MSVKSMTADQIQDDLESIVKTWPGGVPPEQTDRVNALKGELKRRGVEARVARPQSSPSSNGNGKPASIKAMDDTELEKELRRLSTAIGLDPGDDDLQNRFADVRFEMRKRAKADGERENAQPPTPPVQPRAIEIPDEVEAAPTKQAEAAPTTSVKGFAAMVGGGGVVFKYTAQDQHGSVVQLANLLTPDEADELAMVIARTARAARTK